MTHTNTSTSTDQERAAFEAQFKHLDLTQEPDAWGVPRYKHAAIWLAWEAWQAALRAPVPPPGYRLQPLSEYDAMCAFIATTAPQPSEGLMTTEAEATPVQMPNACVHELEAAQTQPTPLNAEAIAKIAQRFKATDLNDSFWVELCRVFEGDSISSITQEKQV